MRARLLQTVGFVLLILLFGTAYHFSDSRKNTQERVGTDIRSGDTVTVLPAANDEEGDTTLYACPADARQCPDGSFVGRSGPDCTFEACPAATQDTDTSEVIVCDAESKAAQMCTMEYAPVCGLVAVQCVTTPCNPVPETFSNGCSACAQGNVISYTRGACPVEY